MKTNPSHADKIVREQHRASQGLPPSTAAAIGLAATLCLIWLWHRSFAPVEDWSRLRLCWIAGIVLTLVGVLVAWRRGRRSLLCSAAELDAALEASSRLETATALRDVNDPLARAQREETERFLDRTRVNSNHRPVLLLLRGEVLLLTLAHAATLLCWTRPWNLLEHKLDSSASAKEKEQIETASLEWKSPDSETTATEIEEVPLEAEANSTSGLRDVTLEVGVNGKKRLTQPLAGDELKHPGKHPIKTSLYLDQLEVKTYDMVSYHLRAQRQGRGKLPPTVSPVQFVQVKPMREDTFVCPGADKAVASKCFNYVTALKAAQLRLMKENFALAHAEIGHDHPEWAETNDRVGNEQDDLAGKTGEVVQILATNRVEPEIVTLVRQSQPLMKGAAGKIKDRQNEPALPPQAQALSYLTKVEKYFQNSIVLSGQSVMMARDPFERARNLELKEHLLTLAGKVDKLAAEQSKLAGDLARTNASSSITMPASEGKESKQGVGAFAKRQSEIKLGISELLDHEIMEPEALKHMQAGHDQASAAQASLERNDIPAAREPAATAARELRQTAAALRESNAQAVKNELAEALLKLAEGANSARHSPQMKSDVEARAELAKAEAAVQEAAQRLADAARAQQGQGKSDSAGRLNELSRRLQDESLQKLMSESRAQPRDAVRAEALAAKLDQLAEQVAHQRNSSPLSPPQLSRLVDKMERARMNLGRLASSCPMAGAGQLDQGQGAGGQKGPSGQSGQSGQSGKQGEKGGQKSEQANNTPQGSKSGGQKQQSGKGSEGSVAKSPGGGGGSGQLGTSKSSAQDMEEKQRQFAEQLLDDLRESAWDAESVLSSSGDLGSLSSILSRAKGSSLGLNRLPGLFEQIDPPLQGVIRSLREELANARRRHQLVAAELEQAPPAYRPAVADYFERLSRDYEPAKSAGRDAANP